MSRVEMIKRLPTPQQLQQSVEVIEKQVSLIQAELSALPMAIAQELASIQRLAESVDQSMSAQRRTVESMLQTMLQGMNEAQTKQEAWLKNSLTVVKEIQTEATANSKSVALAAKRISSAKKLPEQINKAAEAAKTSRSQVWKAALISGLVSSVLTAVAVVGIHALNKPAQPVAASEKGPQEPDVWQQLRNFSQQNQ